MGIRQREEIDDDDDDGFIDTGGGSVGPGMVDVPETTFDEDDDDDEQAAAGDDDAAAGDDAEDADDGDDEAGEERNTRGRNRDRDREDETVDERRARRRRERHRNRDRRKQFREQDQRQIASLRKQNEELQERLARVESRQGQGDMARLDEAINRARAAQEAARRDIREARDAGDLEAEQAADERLYTARRDYESMTSYKQRAQQARQQSQAATQVDPRVHNHAKSFMDRHPQYDVNLGDEDSMIVDAIDTRVRAEGFDPATPEYWSELEDRVYRRLPHWDPDGDDAPRRGNGRQARNSGGNGRRGARMDGGGNASGRAGGNDGGAAGVPREAIAAWKEAGLWGDPKVRAELIKEYKQNERRAGRG